MKNYVLIDLDGTLTDSQEGITKSLQYALQYMNVIEEDLDKLTRHIGPPLRESIDEYYGFNEEDTIKVIRKYRERYNEKGLYENKVYDGIERTLSKLKQAGKYLIVATSKPEDAAKRVLEHFYLDCYFDDICGSLEKEGRNNKVDVIIHALEKNQIKDLSKVVMVGDRKYDIEGAKTVGISSIGVLYGFGSRKELEEAGADKIAETPEEIYDIVVSL